MYHPKNRDQWSFQWESTLAILGYVLGIDFIGSLPTGLYLQDGGPYLFLHILFLCLIGAPLLFLMLSLGQYCSSGPLSCWRFAPIFSGIGLSLCIYDFLKAIYLAIVPMWSLLLLSKLGTISDVDCSTADNCSSTFLPIFRDVLGDTGSDSNQYGQILSDKAGAMFGIYFIVFASLMLGVKVYGKLTYFITLFPFFAIVLLFIRAMTLEGATQGIKSYFNSDFGKLKKYETWIAVFRRSIFSTPPSIVFIALGSYNKFRNDAFRDTVMVVIGKVVFTVLAAFTLGAFKGYIAYIWNIPVSSFAIFSGIYDTMYMLLATLSNVPVSSFWIAILLLAVTFLSFSSLSCVVLGLATGITDLLPVLSTCKGFTWLQTVLTRLDKMTSTVSLKIFRGKVLWIIVLAVICILLFLLALPMTRQGPISQMFLFLDTLLYYFVIDPLYIICLCILMIVFYGALKFSNDFDVMVNGRILFCLPWKVFKFLCIGWWCLLPILMILEMIGVGVEKKTELEFYPSTIEWQNPVGKFLLCLIMLPMPFVAVVVFVYFLLGNGSISEKIRSCFSPTKEWGPLKVEDRCSVMDHHSQYGFILDPRSDDANVVNDNESSRATSSTQIVSTNEVQLQMTGKQY